MAEEESADDVYSLLPAATTTWLSARPSVGVRANNGASPIVVAAAVVAAASSVILRQECDSLVVRARFAVGTSLLAEEQETVQVEEDAISNVAIAAASICDRLLFSSALTHTHLTFTVVLVRVVE